MRWNHPKYLEGGVVRAAETLLFSRPRGNGPRCNATISPADDGRQNVEVYCTRGGDAPWETSIRYKADSVPEAKAMAQRARVAWMKRNKIGKRR